MKSPGAFGWVNMQEASDLVDALALASEELRYRQELTEDYTDEDRANMLVKAERIDVLYRRAVIAWDGAARNEQRLVEQKRGRFGTRQRGVLPRMRRAERRRKGA